MSLRNRLAVFRQWAWTYLTFRDGARLITGSQDLPGWDAEYGIEREAAAEHAAASAK